MLVRIDGKAFHTYTRGVEKSFDEVLAKAMWETSKYLCETIQGCKLAYTQSDEITLLLINYKPGKKTSDSYFNNNKTKIETSAASKATVRFNQIMTQHLIEEMVKSGASQQEIADQLLTKKSWAEFDARAWVLPQDEVNNCFVWRQQDATKIIVTDIDGQNVETYV